MNAMSFILKFTAGCILAWLALAILSFVMTILGYIWKPMFAIIGIFGIYLAISGKYVSFSEKVASITSRIVGTVKH